MSPSCVRCRSCSRLVALALLVAGIGLGCTRSSTAPSTSPMDATPSSAPPSEGSDEDAASGRESTESAAAPSDVARALADEWCERGGDQFAPPGVSGPDDYPPSLDSCAEVESGVDETRTLGPVTASVLVIDAFYEARDVLLYQDGRGQRIATLSHEYEDESGEAGVYTTAWRSIELRDVYGDEAPEWIATKVTMGGDSFEADRCYAHDDYRETLLICTPAADALRCLSYDYADVHVMSPRFEEELYDCDDPPPADEEDSRDGFETSAKVERGAVVFEPTDEHQLTEVSKAPLSGRIDLEVLFDEHPLEPEE